MPFVDVAHVTPFIVQGVIMFWADESG